MFMDYLTFCYCLLLTLGSCGSPSENSPAFPQTTASSDSIITPTKPTLSTDSAVAASAIPIEPNFTFQYNLSLPIKSLQLPSRLTEISGLGLTNDESMLASVQDEKGNLYLVNKYDGKVENKIDFGRSGDYEGVEIIGDDAYVVNSSGTIYEIIDLNSEEPTVNKYNTFLKSTNDVEGLAYDKRKNHLLLACKGRPADGKSLADLRKKKAIYAFDLDKKELNKDPSYTITLEAVQAYIKRSTEQPRIDKLAEQFKAKAKYLDFSPSAIAFHPKDNDLYILSSSGKAMMILDQNGKIKYMEKLRKKIHTQPEGIVFSTDGTLYISNEGTKKKAKIHIFFPLEN